MNILFMHLYELKTCYGVGIAIFCNNSRKASDIVQLLGAELFPSPPEFWHSKSRKSRQLSVPDTDGYNHHCLFFSCVSEYRMSENNESDGSNNETERRGEDANDDMERNQLWFVGCIRNHSLVRRRVRDFRDFFLHYAQPFDADFLIEWYYIGEGYDPTWLPLSTVQSWENGYVHFLGSFMTIRLDFMKEYITLRRRNEPEPGTPPVDTPLPTSLIQEHAFRVAAPGPHVMQIPGRERDLEIDANLLSLAWPQVLTILHQMMH